MNYHQFCNKIGEQLPVFNHLSDKQKKVFILGKVGLDMACDLVGIDRINLSDLNQVSPVREVVAPHGTLEAGGEGESLSPTVSSQKSGLPSKQKATPSPLAGAEPSQTALTHS